MDNVFWLPALLACGVVSPGNIAFVVPYPISTMKHSVLHFRKLFREQGVSMGFGDLFLLLSLGLSWEISCQERVKDPSFAHGARCPPLLSDSELSC